MSNVDFEDSYWERLDQLIEARSVWRRPSIPAKLYHYTTGAAFLEIIKSGQLWFSDFRHMNDLSEVHYGVNLLEAEIAKRERQAVDAELLRIYASFRDELKRVPSWIDVFFLSLCQENNLLNQWRVYGRDSAPISIEFDTDAVMPKTWDAYSFDIMPMIYNQNTQWQIVEIMCLLLSDLGRHEEFHVETFAAACADWCIQMKHPQFQVENEWRFVTRFGLEHRKTKLNSWRSTSTGIVQYLTMRPKNRPLPITGVTVGPCLDPEKQARAIGNFLMARDYHWVTVSASNLPMRT